MKNVLLALIISCFCFMLYGAGKATKPTTFTSNTAAKSSEVNGNFDSVYVPFNKLVDTVNITMPRWSGVLRNHDSTIQYMKIDSIRSAPNIDTIIAKPLYLKGKMIADSIWSVRDSSTLLKADTINSRKIVATGGFVGSLTGAATSAGTFDSATCSVYEFQTTDSTLNDASLKLWYQINKNQVSIFFEQITLTADPTRTSLRIHGLSAIQNSGLPIAYGHCLALGVSGYINCPLALENGHINIGVGTDALSLGSLYSGTITFFK